MRSGLVVLAAAMLSFTCPGLLAQRGATVVQRVRQLDPPTARQPASPLSGLDRSIRPRIMLTGYWPPTNEAVRRFSTSPVQNPAGWIGGDWEGRGYDVHAFFPEFSPPNCTNCGRGSGDLEVDYQDTSPDFWRLANALQPIAIITFSRGANNNTWEVEMNQYNRTTWVADYVDPRQPTPVPPDSSVPASHLRLSKLPVQNIVNAVNAANLGTSAFICYSGNGGGFLSEFIAYHGVWYQSLHRSATDPAWCISAGHVHVGLSVSWTTAQQAAAITLREVIKHVDAIRLNTLCQKNLGYGGPGRSQLAVCGNPLTVSGLADVLLAGAPPSVAGGLLLGLSASPTPFLGGQIVPFPPLAVLPFTTDAQGSLLIEGFRGAPGPLKVYLQGVHVDLTQTQGAGISNAVEVVFP